MPGSRQKAPIITAEDLTLGHAQITILRDAAFSVAPGEALALVGINGSGKSTLLRALAGLARPPRGKLRVFGGSPWRNANVRQRIGWLPEHIALFPELRIHAALRHAAALAGVPRRQRPKAADTAIERCGLTCVAHRRGPQLSLGYRRRLGLAQALIHDPDLLLLDEPSNGLDASVRAEVYALLETLRPQVTLVFATHVPADLVAIATRSLVLQNGRLLSTTVRHDWALSITSNTGPEPAHISGVNSAKPRGNGHWRLQLAPDANPAEVLAKGIAEGWQVRDWRWLGQEPEALIAACAKPREPA